MAAVKLLLFGTRNAVARLLGIAAGIGIGVLLAMLLIAGANALETRDIRGSWMMPSVQSFSEDGADAASSVLVASGQDAYRDHLITRMDLAVPAHPEGEQPPAALPIPAPGSYVASPALARIIAQAPPNELQQRYGAPAGTIPASLLSSPDALYVVVGHTPAEIRAIPGSGIAIEFGGEAYGGNGNYQVLAVIGAIALLIPAFLLVSVATNLGAASRSERWQTLLTIGASRALVGRIAALEAALTSIAGAALGVAAFFALRPALAQLPVNGERLVAGDLTLPAGSALIIIAVVCIGSILAALRAARRIDLSPSSRVVFEPRPRLWRVLPLLTGLITFIALNLFGKNAPIPTAPAIVFGFALVALGLLFAGPWFTWLAGRLFERATRSASGVVASRRITKTPRAGFRSVAGLVAATFLFSVFAFAVSAHVGEDSYMRDPLMPKEAVAALYLGETNPSRADIEGALAGVPGVTGIRLSYTDESGDFMSGDDIRALGHSSFTGAVGQLTGGVFSLAPSGPPVHESTTNSLAQLQINGIVLQTDGTPGSIELARTALLRVPGVDLSLGAWPRAEIAKVSDTGLATQFAEIGRLAILIVSLLAAAVLTISSIAALVDRKRTFALLNLIGMPSNTLRRIITWETLVPLLGIVIPALVLGWFTALMLITTLSNRQLGWPDSLLGMSVLATAIMAVASILIASRVGARITRTAENTRTE